MNSFSVEYSKAEYRKLAPKKEVAAFLKRVLEHENLDGVQFSVSFVKEEEIQSLNLQYRNLDESTDILSFALQDGADNSSFITAPSRYLYIGDMVICPEVCERNAAVLGLSTDEELHRLLVHGVLHLSGMDHKSNDAFEPMLMHQEDIMKKLYSRSN